MNTSGTLFRITTFGESHGPALGVVIDGMPAGFIIDRNQVRFQMRRRKTGQSTISSARHEDDENFEVLSGMFEDKTTGHPLTLMVRNVDAKPGHYEKIKDIFRPNHADFTYFKKYGIRDYRGGGRSSARETVARVLGGAIARQILYHYTGANIIGYTKQIGAIVATGYECDYIETNIVRSPDINTTESMITCIQEVAKAGDSIGGIVECRIVGIPVGIGEPVFGKLKARLASSMLSIGGVLGFEYGKGFEACSMKGSQYNDPFIYENNRIHPKNNYCGGVLGGISTGDDVIFRVALKPTSSIYQQQTSVDMGGNVVEFMIGGRHDPCIVPRAVPIIEAMAAIDCLDLYMIHRAKTFNY